MKRRLHVEPKLVGSLAKDTHLADPLDVDVFILFPPTTSRTDLERHGVALGKAVLKKPILKYAEHPYVHGQADGFSVDIVPAYKLRDAGGKLSAVDRTPFHTRYVGRHATKRQRREIRLFKRFLRGTGCYGAETAVGGLSGYLAELLILKYKSFPRAVEAIASWKPPIELALDARPSPMGGPFVFIDPVDPSRNAAAAVTASTLARLQRAAQAFLNGPRYEFFFPAQAKPPTRAELSRLLRGRAILALDVPAPPGRPETILPQTTRLLGKVDRFLQDHAFEVVHRDVFPVGRNRILLLMEHRPTELPLTYHHSGPRAGDEAHAERFRAKWKGHADVTRAPRLEDGRWTVTLRRHQRTPRDLVAPRIGDFFQGFDYRPAQIRRVETLVGAEVAAEPARAKALAQFLRRADPWDL